MKSTLSALALISLLISGCAWGSNMREVQSSHPAETRLVSAPATPLAQCTLVELERRESLDKGFWNNYRGHHGHVYQLRQDGSIQRIAIYVPGAWWFLLPFPDIAAGADLVFVPTPDASNQTTVEFRAGGYPWDPRSLDVLWPAIQQCADSSKAAHATP